MNINWEFGQFALFLETKQKYSKLKLSVPELRFCCLASFFSWPRVAKKHRLLIYSWIYWDMDAVYILCKAHSQVMKQISFLLLLLLKTECKRMDLNYKKVHLNGRRNFLTLQAVFPPRCGVFSLWGILNGNWMSSYSWVYFLHWQELGLYGFSF